MRAMSPGRSRLRLAGGVVLVAAAAVGAAIVVTNEGRDRGAARILGVVLALGLGLLGWRPRGDDDPATEPGPRSRWGAWRSYVGGSRRSLTGWYEALLLRIVVGILLLVAVVKLLTLLL